MSDPVTNVEIEDVLSSIRRLVSENARAGQAPAQGESEAAPGETAEAEDAGESPADAPAPGGDMLVLTPALRVVEPDEAVGAEDDGEAPERAAAAPEETHHWADDGAETAIEEAAEEAGFAAAVEAVTQEVTQEVLKGGAPEDAAEDAPEVSAEEALETPMAAFEFAHAEPDENGEMASLADRIAGLEAAVAARDDQWEPDGEDEGDDYAGAPVEALNWEDSAPEPGSRRQPAGHAHVWEADALDAEEAGEPAGADEEAAIPPMDEAEEAGPVLDDDLDRGAELFAPDPDAAVIDEDTLRELVADIVRRELQGSLGERITRNVRKLVRREIHRALAARELD